MVAHRPRREGRHGLERDQAGRARDRRDGRRAPVRRTRATGCGSTRAPASTPPAREPVRDSLRSRTTEGRPVTPPPTPSATLTRPCATSPRSRGARRWGPTTSPSPPAALSEVGARVLEALDARCARAALEARSESPWDRLRAVLREAGAHAGRRGGGRRATSGATARWRPTWCGASCSAPPTAASARVRATDPLNDPEALGPVARACEEAGVEFVPTLIVGPAPDPGDPRWLDGGARARRPARRAAHLRVGRRRPPRRPRMLAGLVAQVARGHRPRPSRCRCRRPAASRRCRPPRRSAPAPSAVQASAGPVALVVGPPLGRDAAGRPGRRRRAPSTARRRRSTAPRAWSGRCCPPTACARPRPPSSAPPSAVPPALEAGPDLAPGPPAACRAAWSRSPPSRPPWRRDVGAATLAYPLGAAILAPGRPPRHRRPPLGRDRARAGARSPSAAPGACAAPVAPEAARGRAARADPGEPRVRDLAAVAEEAPQGLSEEDLVLWAMFAETTEQVVGAAALARRRGRQPAGPAGDRPRPARDPGRRGRGLRRGRGERRDLRRPGHGAPRRRARPARPRRGGGRRRRGRDGTTRTAWCGSPARWSAPSTGAPRPTSRPFVRGGPARRGRRHPLPDRGDEALQRDRRRAGRDRAHDLRSRTPTPAEFGQLLFSDRAREAPGRQPRRDRGPRHPHGARARHPDGGRLLDGRRRDAWPSTWPTRRSASGRRRRATRTSTSRNVLGAAEITGCDAVHPGYGFLSENPTFAEACATEGITFVGPSPEVMQRMGDKIAAKARGARGRAAGAGGLRRPGRDVAGGAGGGRARRLPGAAEGRGRRRRARACAASSAAADLPGAFEVAQREAEAAFSDGGLYVERLLEGARHVEIQVMADGLGGVAGRAATASARSSAATRSSSRRPRRRTCPPRPASAMHQAALRARARRGATAAPARWSSWSTPRATSSSSSSTRACRWSTRSPSWSPASTSWPSSCGVAAGGLLSPHRRRRGARPRHRVPHQRRGPGRATSARRAGRLRDFRIAQGPRHPRGHPLRAGRGRCRRTTTACSGKLCVWAADRPRAVARLRPGAGRDLGRRASPPRCRCCATSPTTRRSWRAATRPPTSPSAAVTCRSLPRGNGAAPTSWPSGRARAAGGRPGARRSSCSTSTT